MPAELSDAARALLAERRFAVLGTPMPDGQPQLTVMWYDFRHDHIMMNTLAGRVKDGNMRRDPRLAFCVEDEYRYVTIYGTATLIEDQAIAQADIAYLARRYESAEQAEGMIKRFVTQHRVTIHMSIDRVSEHF